MLTKAEIKELKSLQQKKYRDEKRSFVVEGTKIVNEALNLFPSQIEIVLYTNEAKHKLQLNDTINHEIVNQDVINRISSLKTPQPCIAVMKITDKNSIKAKSPSDIILALDSIKDPGNLGTIIRLADWFGISVIVCSSDCVDCYNPKVVQATMGAIFRVNIYYENLSLFLRNNILKDTIVYGATLEGEDIYKAELQFPAIVVMGNESEGISGTVKKQLSKELQIPNFSSEPQKSESLNVSVATSVILSEMRRRQNYSK